MRQFASSIRVVCMTSLVIWLLATPAGATTRTWDSGGGDGLWSTPQNWNPNGVPGSTDDVIIPASTTDHIKMDRGSQLTPDVIASLTWYSSPLGSLTIEAFKGLRINGDFECLGGADPECKVIMEPHSLLDLVDEDGDADLIEINVSMDPVTSGAPTELRVDGDVIGGDAFEVNEGGIVDTGLGVLVGDPPFPATTFLRGDWTVADGGEITIRNIAEADPDAPLNLTLDAGSTVKFLEAPYAGGVFGASNQNNTLRYGLGYNLLHVGYEGAYYPALHLGLNTVISPLKGLENATLELYLYAKFSIASFFGEAFVRDEWDSRGVDITARPFK